MNRVPRLNRLVLSMFCVLMGTGTEAAIDLTGRFIITTNFPPLATTSWDIAQSGTSLSISFADGPLLASGTIDVDTGAFSLTDTRPYCPDMVGPPGTISGTATDNDHFSGGWTTPVHSTPTICGSLSLAITGVRDYCGNGLLDPSEQCDGSPCCAANCRFAEDGTTCDDGNATTSPDQCVGGVCSQLTVRDFVINTYTTGSQAISRNGSNAAGDVVVVWYSFGQDGSGNGVYGQRFDSTGGRLGSEFQVNSYTTSSQWYPTVAVSSDAFLVVWQADGNQDGSNTGVFARRYSSSGAPLGTEFQVNTFTTSAQSWPGAAVDDAGNALIAWSDFGGPISAIAAQRYDSNGALVGSEFHISDAAGSNKRYPVLAPIGDNTFVAIWNAQGGSTEGVRGRRCDASGPLDTEFVVAPDGVEFQGRPAVAADPISGSFLVVWASDAGGSLEIAARLYASDGTALGSVFIVNTDIKGDQNEPSVSAEPGGTFLVLWAGDTDGESRGVFAQRLANDGAFIGTEFRVQTYGIGRQDSPAAAPVGNAQWLVSWTDWTGFDGNGIGVVGGLIPAPPLPPTPTPTSTPVATSTPTAGAAGFKCYQGIDLQNPAFASVSATTIDQIKNEPLSVDRLKYLCVPEGNAGTTPMACYSVRGQSFMTQPTTEVSTQFQTSRFALKKPRLLCVPGSLAVLP